MKIKEQKAKTMMDRFTIRLEDANASVYDLVAIREELHSTSISLLRELFTLLINKNGIGTKAMLADAIAYNLQVKYYFKMHKVDAPQSLITKAEELVSRCLI